MEHPEVADRQSLTGQVVVVAGAGSGIGRVTALTSAVAGADVVLVGRDSRRLQGVLEEIRQVRASGDVGPAQAAQLALQLDLTQPESADSLAKEVVERLGKIDVIVYGAGLNTKYRALDKLSVPSWQEIVDTNLNGAFYVTKAVLPAMRSRGHGLLIYLSSAAAKRADTSGAAYQASKAGLAALAHATMEECRDDGVRTTVIFPGMVDTEFVRHRPSLPEPAVLGRALQPEDVAAACLFVMTLPARAHVPELLLYMSQP
jgi:NADP-dependent 3-hydroxy acid dehydrogenase YdfG